MKILVLTNLYPPHHAGTYDFRCQSIAEALRLRGHTVRVLTSKHGMKAEQRGTDADRRLILQGAFEEPEVTAFGEVKALETHNHRVLRETIEEFKPDLIHVFSMVGLSKSLMFSLRQSRLPTVYDVADRWIAEGLPADPWLRWWNCPRPGLPRSIQRAALELLGKRNELDRIAPTRMMKGYDRVPEVFSSAASLRVVPDSISAFRFDRLYFCSQALRDETRQAGYRVSHADVIYPGISTQQYVGDLKPASQPLARFLVVSRLDSRSGVLTAVKALKLARDEGASFTLAIYGGGNSQYIAEIRSFAAMHQLPVEFLPVSNIARDLPPLYRKHDGLLYTTEWNEPFSPTPLQAMACGLPVIGAEAGGAAEMLRHRDNALTYQPGDEVALAQRMLELHEDPKLRCQLAEKAQEEVVSNHNETAVVDRIENYLQTSLEIWAHSVA